MRTQSTQHRVIDHTTALLLLAIGSQVLPQPRPRVRWIVYRKGQSEQGTAFLWYTESHEDRNTARARALHLEETAARNLPRWMRKLKDSYHIAPCPLGTFPIDLFLRLYPVGIETELPF